MGKGIGWLATEFDLLTEVFEMIGKGEGKERCFFLEEDWSLDLFEIRKELVF